MVQNEHCQFKVRLGSAFNVWRKHIKYLRFLHSILLGNLGHHRQESPVSREARRRDDALIRAGVLVDSHKFLLAQLL